MTNKIQFNKEFGYIEDESGEQLLKIMCKYHIAEYICKCVNNHEKLVEVLEGAEHIFRDLSDYRTADMIEKILKELEQ